MSNGHVSDEQKTLADRVAALEARVAELASLLQSAIQYLSSDPASSLTKSRLVLEKVLIALYRWEMDKLPARPMIRDFLADKAFIATIPRRIAARMTAIRDLSNLGPHGEEVNATDAKRVMVDLIEVLEWYVDQHGGTYVPSNPLVQEVAGSCKIELSGFLSNEHLELYYNMIRDGVDLGYICKGRKDPGFRIGNLIEIPRVREPIFRTLEDQIRRLCATNGLGMTVQESPDSLQIQMDAVIYGDGFNKKTFSQTLETVHEVVEKVRTMLD
jgi:hypothetical protein